MNQQTQMSAIFKTESHLKMGFATAQNRDTAKNETTTSSVPETKTPILSALEVSAASQRQSGIRGTRAPGGVFVIQLHERDRQI